MFKKRIIPLDILTNFEKLEYSGKEEGKILYISGEWGKLQGERCNALDTRIKRNVGDHCTQIAGGIISGKD